MNILLQTLQLRYQQLLAQFNALRASMSGKGNSVAVAMEYHPSIIKWANAVASAEGAKSYLNNPGDLKVSTLTKSWGAKNGFQATDSGWIAKFDTYQQGFDALCNFLTLGAENELVAFHDPESRTLEGFTKIYAGNPKQDYYAVIYQKTGCIASTLISSFLD